MKRTRSSYLLGVIGLSLIVTGCSVTALPLYNTVRDESLSALQSVVDALPNDAEVSDGGTEQPYPCDGGYFYTGYWTVRLPTDFDTAKFVDELPGSLGEDFELDAVQGPTGISAKIVATHHNNTGVVISDRSTADARILDLLSTSRCAQSPE